MVYIIRTNLHHLLIKICLRFLAPEYLRARSQIYTIKLQKKIMRSHGDGIYIDEYSVEAFEEIFWQTFSKSHYKNLEVLKPYNCTNDEILKLENYHSLICRKEKNQITYVKTITQSCDLNH